MEKTLIIDGREVTFKSTAATSLRYKAQFHRDFLIDVLNLDKAFDKDKKEKKNKRNKNKHYDKNKNNTNEDIDLEDINLEKLDFELIYNIIWVLAKTADKSIPAPLAWYDSFDEFDVFDVFLELQDLILKSISSKKK